MTASEQHGRLPGRTGRTYSYNLDHIATPGGMKVRWKIRIATGREAERLDILQQRAIIDLLSSAVARAHVRSRFESRANQSYLRLLAARSLSGLMSSLLEPQFHSEKYASIAQSIRQGSEHRALSGAYCPVYVARHARS